MFVGIACALSERGTVGGHAAAFAAIFAVVERSPGD
jgi:hypothetical protein